MDFMAVDFETANEKRSSACSIGLAIVKAGKIVETKHFLIKPPVLHFNPFNVSIHGISAKDVKNQPQFDEIWSEIKGYFESNPIVAHNASFDMSVLRSILDTYNLPYPETNYSCTVVISKKLWPHFPSHKLNKLASHFGIEFKHHNAEEDASACAQIALEACRETGVNLLNLAEHLEYSNGALFADGYKAMRSSAADKVKKARCKLSEIGVKALDIKELELPTGC